MDMTEKTMFHAVCNKFAKAMGSDTLIPVKSMDRSTDIQPMHVVVKKTKKHFIFFRKTHYMPYDFQLQDLLEEAQKLLDVSIHTFEFCEFNPTSKYSLSGKIGIEIMEELMDAEITASDSVLISSPLGTIEKREVKSETLLKALSGRKINFDHTFVQQMRERPKDVLCIVNGVCQVQKDAEIKRVDNIDGEGNLKGKIPSCHAGGEISGKVSNERDQDVVVPAGTPIAYNVVELKVDTANGYMEPQVVKGCHGGFVKDELTGKLLAMDVSDAPSHKVHVEVTEKFLAQNAEEIKRIKKTLTPIKEMDASKKSQLRLSLVEVMAHPADMGVLADLLGAVENKLLTTETKKKLSCFETSQQNIADLLQILGFHVEDKLFSYSGEVTPFITAAGYIFDALEEVTMSELQMLRECLQNEPSNINQIAALCANAVVKKSPTHLTTTLPPESAAFRLATHLGFTVQNEIASPPKMLSPSIDQVYCVMYSFSDS